jgi:hypothetical protein
MLRSFRVDALPLALLLACADPPAPDGFGNGCRLDSDCEEGQTCRQLEGSRWDPEANETVLYDASYCTLVCETEATCPEYLWMGQYTHCVPCEEGFCAVDQSRCDK